MPVESRQASCGALAKLTHNDRSRFLFHFRPRGTFLSHEISLSFFSLVVSRVGRSGLRCALDMRKQRERRTASGQTCTINEKFGSLYGRMTAPHPGQGCSGGTRGRCGVAFRAARCRLGLLRPGVSLASRGLLDSRGAPLISNSQVAAAVHPTVCQPLAPR